MINTTKIAKPNMKSVKAIFWSKARLILVNALFKVLLPSLNSWIDHRGASKGAALAFYALFSLAPILILVIAVAGYFFSIATAQYLIIKQMQTLVGYNGSQAILALLNSAQDPSAGRAATWIAIVLLLVGATSVFAELKGSLDELWGVQKSKLSPMSVLLRTRLLSFGLVMVLAFLLLISLIVSALLNALEIYIGGVWISSALLFTTVSSLASFGVITCLFAVIYKMLPDAPISWSDVTIGSMFTACLFTLGKYLIGLYIGNGSATSGFGAAGSVIALLLWVYYSAQIFFLGAEFTRQYALRFGSLKQLQEQQLALDKNIAEPLHAINPSLR